PPSTTSASATDGKGRGVMRPGPLSWSNPCARAWPGAARAIQTVFIPKGTPMIHDNEPAMRRNMALGRNKRLAVAIVAALSMGTIGSAAADGLWVLGGATTFEDYLQSIVNGQAHDGNLGALATGNQMGAASPAAGEMTVSANVVQALTLDPDTGLLGVNGADNAISLEL